MAIDDKINQWLNKDKGGNATVDAGDDTVVNFFLMVLKKVVNRTLMGAEYSVVSESAQAEALKELCDDLQDNMHTIVGHMLGNSVHAECWVVPSILEGSQRLVHSYITGDKICITQTKEDGNIAECYMIIDAVKRKDKVYLLCRKHNLEDNGDLVISYFVADENAKGAEGNVPEWDSLINTETRYPKVNHIGFGRYKSPVIAYNADIVYGVPLNYGCGFIEKQLKLAVEYIEQEMKASKKKLFPDWSIVRTSTKDGAPVGMYQIDEHIYPIRKKAGESGSLIDDYSPAVRGSEYEEHLNCLLDRYQALMGVSELITHKTTNGATATEIKALNADNLSMEQNIKKAIRRGNIETLEADGIYLGISRDLWDYDEEYADIYSDEQQELRNYIDLYNTGALELRDLVGYWFPTFSDEQIVEKVQAIKAEKESGTKRSIEELLTM